LKHRAGPVIYPAEFNSDYIRSIEPCFTEAFSEIIEKSGRKEHIKAMFKQRMEFLETRKYEVFQRREWFENPKKYKGICFIRIKDNNKNIRISFKMLTFKGKQYAILISAFTETKDATSKTESHKSHIKSIKDILENIEEVLVNGI
jgi:hypothetical protein